MAKDMEMVTEKQVEDLAKQVANEGPHYSEGQGVFLGDEEAPSSEFVFTACGVDEDQDPGLPHARALRTAQALNTLQGIPLELLGTDGAVRKLLARFAEASEGNSELSPEMFEDPED